jgi:ADP-heptose:LPS heptosyltransferase
MIDERWQAARRVLAVRLDNLGDVLVTTPAIHAIKSSVPGAEITLLASPVGAQAGKLNPDVADVIVYEAPWVDPWRRLPHESARVQAMIETIRDRQFDAAVIFTSFRQSSLPAAFLCYLADIPLRLAASRDAPGSLLTNRHYHPDRSMHEVERGLDLVGAVGLRTDEVDLVLGVPPAARRQVDEWLATIGGRLSTAPVSPLVVVHPGCSMPARTYPWQQFAEAIALLVDALGTTVVLTGVEEERELVGKIVDALPRHVRSSVHPTTGKLAFPEFCALIEAADLVVTNNTGPMHVAAAVKTPVVALFALTNPPEQWGPWRVPHRLLYQEVPCRLCYSRVCPHDHECLRLVTPAQILDAATELLDGQGSCTPMTVGAADASEELALAGAVRP